MKKILAFILTVLVDGCVATAAYAYTTMYVYTANGKPLNLRDAPSIIGNVMTQIPNGAAVRVNDVLDETWDSVTYEATRATPCPAIWYTARRYAPRRPSPPQRRP